MQERLRELRRREVGLHLDVLGVRVFRHGLVHAFAAVLEHVLEDRRHERGARELA
jgi:hypothetical protein